MNPTEQTILHDPDNGKHGNCLSAVLASLLHVDIEVIPVFSNPDTWIVDLNRWLRTYGLAYVTLPNFDLAAFGISGLFHEIAGNTSRSTDVPHACVAVDGKVTFDPHPSAAGLRSVDSYGIFVALRPWEMANRLKELDSVLKDRVALANENWELRSFYVSSETREPIKAKLAFVAVSETKPITNL